jgi:ammonia channel protein AmtB
VTAESNAGPTHFAGGFTGLICVALFSERSLLQSYLFQNDSQQPPDVGLVFGGSGKLLGAQLLAGIVILAWSAVATATIVLLLKVLFVLSFVFGFWFLDFGFCFGPVAAPSSSPGFVHAVLQA